MVPSQAPRQAASSITRPTTTETVVGVDAPPSAGGSSTSGHSSALQPARPPRKLNRSANQLHRNQACLPCRRRRIKCDAARPHCSSCVRSYRFLARTQPNPERDSKGVQCSYEDTAEAEVDDGDLHLTSSISNPKAAVRKLEARIADLQATLSRLTSSPGRTQTMYHDSTSASASAAAGTEYGWGIHPTSHLSTARQPQSAPTHGGATVPLFSPFHLDHRLNTHMPSLPSMVHGGMGGPMEGGGSGLNLLDLGQQGLDPIALGALTGDSHPSMPPTRLGIAVAHTNTSTISHLEKAGDDDTGNAGGFYNRDVLWPGWSPNLPAPTILDNLIQTFFNVVPSVSRIIHRTAFLKRLALPPTHDQFPHVALLHAICAASARYTTAVHTISVAESVRRTNAEIRGIVPTHQGTTEEDATSHDCFAARHASYALLEMQLGQVTGRRMLEVAQAKAILTVYYQQHGECHLILTNTLVDNAYDAARWIESWMMTGEMARLAVPLGLLNDGNGSGRSQNSLLDAPTEDWDREERRLLIAYIINLDCLCSTTAGWTSSIPLDEMMSRLPASNEDFERGTNIPENPQTWHSDDLYTFHPVADNFVLYCKSIHLLGRVIKFKRRALVFDDANSARSTPLFEKLDNDIAAFQISFPSDKRDPLRFAERGLDADLVGAHLVPHIATIKLHESFADMTKPCCPSAIRILSGARAVLSVVYLLTSTALDFSNTLTPQISSTFVLFYQHALELQDYPSAKVFLSEIDVFRVVFEALAQRFALSARHGGMIDQMLQTCHDDLPITLEDIRSEGDPSRFQYTAPSRPSSGGMTATPPMTNAVLQGPDHVGQPVGENVVPEHHQLHVLFGSRAPPLKHDMDSSRRYRLSPPSPSTR